MHEPEPELEAVEVTARLRQARQLLSLLLVINFGNLFLLKVASGRAHVAETQLA